MITSGDNLNHSKRTLLVKLPIVIDGDDYLICRLSYCEYNRYNRCNLFHTKLKVSEPVETDDFRPQSGYSFRCKECLNSEVI